MCFLFVIDLSLFITYQIELDIVLASSEGFVIKLFIICVQHLISMTQLNVNNLICVCLV